MFVIAPPFYVVKLPLSYHIRHQQALHPQVPCGNGGSCSDQRSRRWLVPVDWEPHKEVGSPLDFEIADIYPSKKVTVITEILNTENILTYTLDTKLPNSDHKELTSCKLVKGL
jgi:hypothetical protein